MFREVLLRFIGSFVIDDLLLLVWLGNTTWVDNAEVPVGINPKELILFVGINGTGNVPSGFGACCWTGFDDIDCDDCGIDCNGCWIDCIGFEDCDADWDVDCNDFEDWGVTGERFIGELFIGELFKGDRTIFVGENASEIFVLTGDILLGFGLGLPVCLLCKLFSFSVRFGCHGSFSRSWGALAEKSSNPGVLSENSFSHVGVVLVGDFFWEDCLFLCGVAQLSPGNKFSDSFAPITTRWEGEGSLLLILLTFEDVIFLLSSVIASVVIGVGVLPFVAKLFIYIINRISEYKD